MAPRRRACSTPEIRQTRGAVYGMAYRRAKRAYNAGFYLESIALVESMMADRLEAISSQLDGEPSHFRTVGQAARSLRKYSEYQGSELLDEVTRWSAGRSRWIHEFAKVSDEDRLSWRGQLADAKRVAGSGLDLLAKVTAEAKRQRRATVDAHGMARP